MQIVQFIIDLFAVYFGSKLPVVKANDKMIDLYVSLFVLRCNLLRR